MVRGEKAGPYHCVFDLLLELEHASHRPFETGQRDGELEARFRVVEEDLTLDALCIEYF